MTRDEVLRLAREAGLIHYYDSESQWSGVTNENLIEQDKNRNDDRLVEILAPFAALVAAHERERIIKANATEIERVNAHLKQDEALLKQALDALEESSECVQNNYLPDRMGHDWDETISALRERLGEKK